MSLRTPTEYVAALKAEGLHLTGHPGWTAVNRPGPWDPHGILNHHTASAAPVVTQIRTLREGRPDLPGPLAHVGTRPDGIIDLVGWFDTNHAGLGDPRVLAAVIADRATPAPRKGHDSVGDPDAVDGNAAFYGNEMMHPGDGKTPWPAKQVDAAVRYNAALCRLHGWKATSCLFHKSWTTRKIDPRWSISLTTFQDKVAERLHHLPSWNPGAAPVPPKPPVVVTVPTPPPVQEPELARFDVALAKSKDLSDYLARLAAGR